jgi:hypothetical protein
MRHDVAYLAEHVERHPRLPPVRPDAKGAAAARDTCGHPPPAIEGVK